MYFQISNYFCCYFKFLLFEFNPDEDSYLDSRIKDFAFERVFLAVILSNVVCYKQFFVSVQCAFYLYKAWEIEILSITQIFVYLRLYNSLVISRLYNK